MSSIQAVVKLYMFLYFVEKLTKSGALHFCVILIFGGEMALLLQKK